MAPRRRKRLDTAWFNLPVDRLRQVAAHDRAATSLRAMLVAGGPAPRATVQVSAERSCVLSGMDESIALLKLAVEDWNSLVVHALYDGDRANAGETVMTIEGPYDVLAGLQPPILGTLARRTVVSTNARAFVEAARPKLVLAFPRRHSHWVLEAGDALSAQIGGAMTLAADPVPPGAGPKPSPHLPPLAMVGHALIGAFGGDTLAAARAFAAHLAAADSGAATPPPGGAPAESVQVVVPVDYENDSVRTALEVTRALEGRVWGVQLATSENLVDVSIIPAMGTFQPTGVNPQLIWNVRNALDAEGFGDVKILASSGVTLERIKDFEDDGVPVDAYGIGAALLAGRTGFTADVVELDRPLRLRVGSERRPNPRLERVK
jgi:nicotinate phosphoribosyltransferase